MLRKITILFTVSIGIVFSIGTVFARPITDYNEENRKEIEKQFTDYIKTLPDVFIGDDIPVTSKMYPTYLYLMRNGFMKEEYKENINLPIKRIEFAEILLNIVSPNLKFPQNILPYDLINSDKKEVAKKALEAGILRIYFDKTIKADNFISVTEVNYAFYNLGMELIEDKDLVITKLQLLTHIVKNFQKNDFSYENYLVHPPNISLEGREFLVNGKSFHGVFVNWIVNGTLSTTQIKEEIAKMKKMGVRGISTEVRFDETMPIDGVFILPEYFKNFLRISAEKGMLVNILISHHYTPKWLYEKYPRDIRLVDIHGVPQNIGEYLTFSIYSPAIQDQIEWQKKAVKSFDNFSNVFLYQLNNEVSFGKEHDLDYSYWAEKAFGEWLTERGITKYPIPKNKSNIERYKQFKRFRQISLTNYHQKLYKEVSAITDTPVAATKDITYESLSHYAPKYGLHPSPKEVYGDYLASDIYGYTPNVYAFHHSFEKPIAVIEMNMPGNWDPNSMLYFIYSNYLHGIAVQSIFQWNCGDHENTLFHCDGTSWRKTEGLVEAIKIINSFDGAYFPPESTSAIILPTHSINLNGHDFEKYQYVIDDFVLKLLEKTGKYPKLLWADDLTSFGYYEQNPNIYTSLELDSLNFIGVLDAPFDNMNSLNMLQQFEVKEDGIWTRI